MLFSATADDLKSVTDSIINNISSDTEMAFNDSTTVFTESLEDILATYHEDLNTIKFLQHVSNSEEIRDLSRTLESKINNFFTDFYSREDYYELLVDESSTLLKNPVQARLNKFLLNFFVSNAVGHPDAQALYKKLSALETEFQKNIADAPDELEFTTEQLKELPEEFLARTLDKETGMHRIKLNVTQDVWTVLDYCSNRQIRRQVKNAGDHIALANMELLDKMIEMRNKYAKILGNKTWVHFNIKDQMFRQPDEIKKLLNELAAQLKPKTDQYFQQLKSYNNGQPLEACDLRYTRQLYLKDKFHINDEELRQYFPFKNVFDNMLKIYSDLFSLTFCKVEQKMWDQSVMTYKLFDKKTEELIGTFYCDLFPRNGKYNHAMVVPLNNGHGYGTEAQQYPSVALLANLSSSQIGLTMYDVETLFHEFGHVIHALCGGYRTRYFHLGFEGVTIDFVEAPSQIIEQWIYHPDVLKKIAPDMPREIMNQVIASHYSPTEIYEYLRTTFLAKIDQEMYLKSNVNYRDLYDKLMLEYFTVPWSKSTFIARWGHPGGELYAGRYYSYMLSLVIAADLYNEFLKSGNVLDPQLGLRYRQQILEPGAIVEPDVLVKNFLGRNYNIDAFIQNNLRM